MIPWPQILETGYPELDAMHRRLVEQCNSLTGLIRDRCPWADVVKAFDALARAIGDHFQAEEHLLAQTAFPRIAEHKLQHQRLEDQLKTLCDTLSAADGSDEEHWRIARSIRGTLLDTLFRHDLDYKSHLEQVAGR